MKNKLLVVISLTALLAVLIIGLLIAMPVKPPAITTSLGSPMQVAVYMGDNNSELRDAFSEKGIALVAYKNATDIEYSDSAILVDAQCYSLDYSDIKRLSEHNTLFFINVESMEKIAKEILDTDSYDVFATTDENLKNTVRIRTDQNGKKKMTVIGYYSYDKDLYGDLIDQMTKWQ